MLTTLETVPIVLLLVIVVDCPGLRDIIYTSYALLRSSIEAAGLSVPTPIANLPTITSPW